MRRSLNRSPLSSKPRARALSSLRSCGRLSNQYLVGRDHSRLIFYHAATTVSWRHPRVHTWRFSGSSTSSTFTTPSLSSSSERGLKSRPTSKDLLSPVARLEFRVPCIAIYRHNLNLWSAPTLCTLWGGAIPFKVALQPYRAETAGASSNRNAQHDTKTAKITKATAAVVAAAAAAASKHLSEPSGSNERLSEFAALASSRGFRPRHRFLKCRAAV